MARLKSFEKFTISSKPVLVTYIHAGVFVPVINPSSSASRYTFSPANNPSLQLMYWDDNAYVTELKLSSNEESAPIEQGGDRPASNHQDSQAKGTKESDKTKKRKAEAASSSNAKKLSMPSQLQFWRERYAEIHANDDERENVPETASEVNTSAADPVVLPNQSFADFENNTCYLCWRMFDDAEHLVYHEEASEMHQENLQNQELRERVMSEMIKHGVVEAPSYRDRAKERRQAFGHQKSVNAGDDAEADSSRPPVTSYANFDLITCLLCDQTFERPETLVLHERHCPVHEKNMHDEEARARGDCEMITHGLAPLPTPIYRPFADDDDPPSSYADLKKNACYLCITQYKAPEDVLLHERISKRHQETLKDKTQRAHSDCLVIQAGLAPLPTPVYRPFPEDPETTSSYADLKEMCCLLCELGWTKPEHVLLHERVDEVHQINMKNKDKRAWADCLLIRQGLATLPPPIYRPFVDDLEIVSSYADLERDSCALCCVKCVSTDALYRHERVSEVHLEYLKNKLKRVNGDRRLVKLGIIPLPTPAYRFSKEDFESDEADGKRASSYADLSNNLCVLCESKFAEPVDVFFHERMDEEHRENLKNIGFREFSLCWLVKNRVVEVPEIYGDIANQQRLEKQRAAFCSENPTAPMDVSYIDPNTNSCWLCWIDFKCPEDTILHERWEPCHKENLKDERLREQARHGFVTSGAFKVPQKDQEDGHHPTARREASDAENVNASQKISEAAQEDQSAAPKASIGASLLRKMGWSQGSGLGAEGTGVTAPISTDVYAPGVGLGAQGGKLGDAAEEAGRNTRGRYEEFLEKTKDNARQRYERMDLS